MMNVLSKVELFTSVYDTVVKFRQQTEIKMNDKKDNVITKRMVSTIINISIIQIYIAP